MANCQGCGAVNDKNALSCAACGRVLALICPQCTTRNFSYATFCTYCGRILTQSSEERENLTRAGEPIAEMISPALPVFGESFPKHAFLKCILGGFIFLFLFLSQAFSGYPLAGILAGLTSGVISFWGLIELFIWAINRMEHPRKRALSEMEEPIPQKLDPAVSSAQGSFEDLDREVSADLASNRVLSKAERISPARRLVKPSGLVASMVSGALDSKPSNEPETSKPAANETPREKTVSEEISEREDETILEEAALPESERKFQTLAEFLEDGINREMASIEKKIAKTPDNFSLLMRLSQLYDERGQFSQAAEIMDKCISFNPQVPEVYLYYGILLKRTGKPDKARQSFEKALSLNRFLSKAYYQLGILERSTRNLSGARDYFQRCIQLSPDDAYAHYQLGMVYREMGDLALAQMEIKRAVLLNPTDSYGHSRLGQIHHQRKQLDPAIAEYSQALSLKPNDPFVLEKLALVMSEKGEDQRAQELLQEAISFQFHPEPRLLIALAKVLHRLKRFADMKPLVEETLRLQPNNPDGLFLASMLRIQEKRPDEALAMLKQLTESSPDRWEAWLEMGKLFQTAGRDEEAISAFIKASPNVTDQAGVWNSIGVLYSNRKEYEDALKAFKKALSFDYSDSQIQNNCKAVQKKVESACKKVIDDAKQMIVSDPNNLDSYLKMGKAFEILDNPEEALIAYQTLLSIKPDSVEGLMAYAELLKKRGKLKMSIRCYREILKIKNSHVEAHIELVKANLNLGFLNEALRHASVAQKLSPDDPRVHFLLGKIYFAKGLAPRALKEFCLVANRSRDPDMISWAELMRRRLSRDF